MRGVFFAKRAILIKLDSVGRVLFVLINVVIALFAFGACKSNSRSCSFSHFLPSRPQRHRFGLNIKLTPRIPRCLLILHYKQPAVNFFYAVLQKNALRNNLLYNDVARASHKVIIYGEKHAFFTIRITLF